MFYTPELFGPAVLPFGYGLSTTTFKYEHYAVAGELSMAPVRKMLAETAAAGRTFPDSNKLKSEPSPVSHQINVTNTGNRDADDVVLGFLKPPGAGVGGVPRQTLFDFQRVFVKAGETVTVHLYPSLTGLTHVTLAVRRSKPSPAPLTLLEYI